MKELVRPYRTEKNKMNERNEGVRGDEFSVGRGWDRRGLVFIHTQH